MSVLRIGPLELDSNLLLAPIAGHTDIAFRILCREQGGVGAAYTDLLNSRAILKETERTLDLARTNEFDQPAGMSTTDSPTLSASAGSGLPVTLTSSTPEVCTVVDGLVTAVAAGSCTVVATQEGDTTRIRMGCNQC